MAGFFGLSLKIISITIQAENTPFQPTHILYHILKNLSTDFTGLGKIFKIFFYLCGMSNGKKLKHLLEKTEDGILYKDEIEDIDF